MAKQVTTPSDADLNEFLKNQPQRQKKSPPYQRGRLEGDCQPRPDGLSGQLRLFRVAHGASLTNHGDLHLARIGHLILDLLGDLVREALRLLI